MMAQRFHIRNKELRIPNKSLRSPYTGHNIGSGVTSLACFRPSFNSQETGARVNGGEMKAFVSCEQSRPKSQPFATCLLSNQSTVVIHNSPEKNVETVNGSKHDNMLLSSEKETNSMSGSALVHVKQKKKQSSSDHTLSMDCDSQLSQLRLLHQPTCHFCGLFGFFRCMQCKQIHYCSVDCQTKDWQVHSAVCKPVKQNPDKTEENSKSLVEVKKKGSLISVDTSKVEEQNQKTMFCDLNALELKKNTKIEGTLAGFSNPNEFYVQVNSPEVVSNINKLSTKLKEYDVVSQDDYIPAKGEVCVAKYSMDQTWYRVLIKDLDILKKVAQVLYIDYGNGESTPLHRIKQLHKDIAHFPPCAIKCCVANATPAKDKWPTDCNSSVASLLLGKYCSLTIVDVLMGEMGAYFAVDVILSDSGKHLSEILLEMRHTLNSKEINSKKEQSTVGPAEKMSIPEKTVEGKGLFQSGCVTQKLISLSVGDVFLGMVAHIETPEIFFCQQLENACMLAELQALLYEYSEKTSPVPDFHPAIGDVCCAQFTEDNQWYRASVLSYFSEKTVLVGYVDFGNFEVLQVSRLRPIIPQLMQMPIQAIRCTLAGLKPVSEIWSTEATSVMKQLTQNKIITIKVMDVKTNLYVVELTDKSVTPMINVAKCLLESVHTMEAATVTSAVAEPRAGTLQEISGEKLHKADYVWVTLIPTQVANVIVSVLYNPTEFYCQLLNDDDLNALNKLNLSLVDYCQAAAPSISKITEGEPCCAYFSGDGKWYRALVKEATTFDAFDIQFVDYGNRDVVTVDKLRKISSEFLELPFQAIRCWLSGVKPLNEEWSPKTVAAFQMYTAGKKLQAKVVSLTPTGAEIELIDCLSTSNPVMISDILIKERFALKKEVLSNQNMMLDELTTGNLPVALPSHCANVSNGGQRTEVCEPTTASLCDHFTEISVQTQWITTEFPVNATLSVRVLEVRDPDLFYVVPTKAMVDPQKFHRLKTELKDYCNSLNNLVFTPKVGEACCARFSGDDNWYRAVVLEVGVSEAKVIYADYGNVEMLPFSRLLPITASYLELPPQIFKCSIAGITELDGKWSISATEKLKALLLNECVTITVKGICENIHAVNVTKRCDNEMLNVADLLEAENPTKRSDGNQCVNQCCCKELKKQVAELEWLLFALLKDQYGEDKVPTMIKSWKS